MKSFASTMYIIIGVLTVAAMVAIMLGVFGWS